MNSPEHEHQHEPIEQRTRELWREAARHLDPATAARLRAARREALQPSDRPRQAVRWLIPSGALAAMALALMMVWQPLPHAPAAGNPAPSAALDADSELPPDAEQVDPGLYQNLDFYAWLAASDRHSYTR